jgi:drug/metabolite transporter (DMT)-like permease
MSPFVFAVVLGAAAIHAGWNAIVKVSRDTLLTSIMVAGAAALIALVTLPFLPPVAPAAWPCLAVSATLETAYYALLAMVYRRADMSRAYPLMRGMPPLLVALVSALALGVALPAAAWAGVALISAGILSLALSGPLRRQSGVGFALATGLVITSYTLVDGFGVRLSGAPFTYAMWIFLLTGLPLVLWALFARRGLPAYVRTYWPFGLAGGIGTLAAYGLVLWAMTEAPVPIVAALRETSIVFATLIGVLALGEPITRLRIAGTVVIVMGIVLLRLV